MPFVSVGGDGEAEAIGCGSGPADESSKILLPANEVDY